MEGRGVGQKVAIWRMGGGEGEGGLGWSGRERKGGEGEGMGGESRERVEGRGGEGEGEGEEGGEIGEGEVETAEEVNFCR